MGVRGIIKINKIKTTTTPN